MHDTPPDQTRRSFLKATSITAAATAGLLAGAGTALAAAPAGAPQPAAGQLNARDFGAKGDGRTDDTGALRKALQAAKDDRIGCLFLPAGTYLLSGTLQMPSNLQLVGAGRGLTTLQAIPDTRFDMFRPDPRTQEIRQRRTMITTESVTTVRAQVVENIAIRHLTVDWNHCPTDFYGHSVLLMDSCDRAVIHDVAVINALPSDHPPVGGSIENRFRCECVMYSNARYGLMDNVLLTDSGYRPLSVSYGSQKITFQNGVIHAVKPPGRHVFCENHGDGMPRDEHFIHSEIIFLNSTFILDGGNGHDGICSHTGTTHVENCDFYIAPEVRSLRIILRPFDGSRNCTYVNNRFHLGRRPGNQFSLIATTRDLRGIDNEAITFAGNIADCTFTDEIGEEARPLVHFPAGDRRIHVRDNRFQLRWEGPARESVIRLTQTHGFVVSNNLIEMQAESAEELVPAIRLEGVRKGHVTGNSVAGDFSHGLEITDEADGVIVSGNHFADASGEAIRIQTSGSVLTGENVT